MPLILKTEVMAINSKDIEALWKRYSDEGVKKGISVVQFFESNGVPYHTFEKWYKKKFSEKGIVDCVVGGLPDGTVQIPDSEKPLTLKPEKRNEVFVSYASPVRDAAGTRGVFYTGCRIV